jgi:streptomycin 6-kinase
MALLSPAVPSPSEVVAVHQRYESHITETDLEGLFDRDRDISALVTGARMAIDPLEGNIDLPDNDLARANSLLEKLRGYLDSSPRVPCHGDLSPGNILQNADGDFVVIDWEDRFWGVRDYDFLYWLTFMNNSSHLNRESLQISRHPRNISVAILTMTVIVKESVSLKAAVPREGRVSPAARLHTVLELL